MTFDQRTALIVVDMQNDFVDPSGTLEVAGAEDTIPFINARIAEAAAAGAVVVYTRDWHPFSTPHFEKDGGIWPLHCIAESWGAEFHPALTVLDEAQTIEKGTEGEDGYSGFSVRDPERPDAVSSTGLDGLLDDLGVTRVVVVGVATDYCVKETALDAARLGYETAALVDGMRAVDLEPGDGDAALDEMGEAGVTVR